MTSERWKTIDECPDYEISTLGRVRSNKPLNGKGYMIKPHQYSNGYWFVGLYEGRKRKARMLHRLVATAFIPNPENKPEVNHINNDPNDNRLENLEWVTTFENKQWMAKQNRQRVKKRPVIGTDTTTGAQTYYESVMDAGRAGYGYTNVIRSCKTGAASHGCVFRYADN